MFTFGFFMILAFVVGGLGGDFLGRTRQRHTDQEVIARADRGKEIANKERDEAINLAWELQNSTVTQAFEQGLLTNVIDEIAKRQVKELTTGKKKTCGCGHHKSYHGVSGGGCHAQELDVIGMYFTCRCRSFIPD